MNKFFIAFIVLIVSSCGDYEHVDPCETRWLSNDNMDIASFLDSLDNGRFTIVNKDGRVENVNVWREPGSTFVPGSIECWTYRSPQMRLVLNAPSLDFGFQCYFISSLNGEVIKFKQYVKNAESLEFDYLIVGDSLLKNEYILSENGESSVIYPEGFSVQKVDTFMASSKMFFDVKIYTNDFNNSTKISNRTIASLVVDENYGFIQFTTKAGEIWDIVYN